MEEQLIKQKQQSYSYFPRKLNNSRLTMLTEQPKPQKTNKFNIQITSPIYDIYFGEHMLTILNKQGITIYSLLTMNIIYQKLGEFYDVKPIPNTNYLLCLVADQKTNKINTLVIMDMQTDQKISEITLKIQINEIKVGKKCIAAANNRELVIIQFPSLQPICHEVAGNGLFNIFDVSYEGLTLAYQYVAKGSLIIHNFTNLQIQKKQRNNSKMSKLTSKNTEMSRKSLGSAKTPLKTIIEIEAHYQRVCLIKVSPSGSRVATASYKGTVIRIFLAATGALWQELRVGYQFCKLLDLHFSEQGNALACLNQSNIVNLFNINLQPNQEMYESHKRGYKIYQQKNNKSFFSFLSFLKSDLGYESPFSHYKLQKPDLKEAQKQMEPKPSDNMMIIHEEDSNEKEEFGLQQLAENQKLIKQKPRHIQERQRNNEVNFKNEKPKTISNESKDLLPKSESQTSNRISVNRSKTQMLSVFKEEDERTKVYNTFNRIYIGGNNFIWAVKGHYIFMIKYDPYNGGQMYHRQTIAFSE